MAIELGSDPTPSTPSITLEVEGSEVIFGLVDVLERQSSDFDSKELLFWDDGKPKMATVLVCEVLSADGCVIGPDDIPAQIGDLFTIWCEKSMHFEWKDCQIAFRKANNRRPSVGDVGRHSWDSTEPPTSKGRQGKKNRPIALRPPTPEETSQTQRLEALYMERNTDGIELDTPSSAAPAAPAAEMPF